MSGAVLPEARGSHLAGVMERERAIKMYRRVRLGRNKAVGVENQQEETVAKSIAPNRGQLPLKNALVKLNDKMTLQEMLKLVGGRIADKEARVKLSKLRPVDCQPHTRTEYIKDLMADIASVGEVLHHGLGVQFGDMVIIADGNRRAAACKELGMDTLPMKLVEGVPQHNAMFVARRLWGLTNRGSLRMTGAYWFAAWALIPTADKGSWLKDCVRPRIAGNIRRMSEVLGVDRAVSVAKKEKVDPCIVNTASRVEKLLVTSVKKRAPDLASIVLWMVENKNDMASYIRTLPNAKSCEKLANAIRKGQPFPREVW